MLTPLIKYRHHILRSQPKKMMIKNLFSDHTHKSFDYKQSYSFCDVCDFNGYPDEKVIFQFEGFRSEDKDGFIYKFRVYDYYPARKRKIKHVHKCNLKLIDKLVSLALKEKEVIA
jgi:hypothetical protein